MAASSSTTVKFVSSLQTYLTTGSASRDASGISEAFTSQYRIEKQVRPVAASGDITITKADEGLTSVDFIQIVCKTAGKPMVIKPDGDTAGITYTPLSATSCAFMIATADFTTLLIENPDLTTVIDVELSLFEKV